MKICDAYGHAEIVFDDRKCPACELRDERDKLAEQVRDLEREIYFLKKAKEEQ